MKYSLALINSGLSSFATSIQGSVEISGLDDQLLAEANTDCPMSLHQARSEPSRLEQCLSSAIENQSIVVASVEARSPTGARQRKRPRQDRLEAIMPASGSVLMDICSTMTATVPDRKSKKMTKSQATDSTYESCLSMMQIPKPLPMDREKHARPAAAPAMGGILGHVTDLHGTDTRQGSVVREKKPGKNGLRGQAHKENRPCVLGGVLAAQIQCGSLVSHFSYTTQQSTLQSCKTKMSHLTDKRRKRRVYL